MTRAFRRTTAGLALTGAALLIAGCGGGSDSLSADELRTQADAICADANAATDAISAPTSADEVLGYLRATRDVQAPALDKLKEISPPSELESDWNRAVEVQEQQLASLDDAITRIDGGEDPEAVLNEIGTDAQARSDELDALASKLGLKVCGSDDSGDDTTTETTTDTDTDTTATTLEPTTDGTESTDSSSTEASGDFGTTDQYLADAQEAAGALTKFGTLLQNVASPADLRDAAPQSQEALDEFDAAIAKLDGYTMEDPTLEKQRSGLVAEGPKVSDVLRRFVDAAASGDASAVQSLLPEVMSALQAFSSAATDIS